LIVIGAVVAVGALVAVALPWTLSVNGRSLDSIRFPIFLPLILLSLILGQIHH
jgi:hypothetical protein